MDENTQQRIDDLDARIDAGEKWLIEKAITESDLADMGRMIEKYKRQRDALLADVRKGKPDNVMANGNMDTRIWTQLQSMDDELKRMAERWHNVDKRLSRLEEQVSHLSVDPDGMSKAGLASSTVVLGVVLLLLLFLTARSVGVL